MFYPSLISLALLQLVAVNASCLRSKAYNAITAFGDSLTDNGRSFAASHGNDPSDPAYYKGRYSNGPVWIEYLADELDVKLTDLAFAGATSNNSRVFGAYDPTIGLLALSALDQLNLYLAGLTSSSPKPADQLYVINIGSNDLFYSNFTAQASDVVGTIKYMIDKLKAVGGKSFLISDIVDLSTVPAAALFPSYLLPLAHQYSLQLKQGVQALVVQEGAKYVSFWDAGASMGAHPALYGFNASLIHDFCLHEANPATPTTPATPRTVCTNPGKYIFWDDVHPTTKAHAVFSVAGLAGLCLN